MKDLIDKRVFYFYQTVKMGGVRLAADSLNIAPSAISRQISQLEKQFGISLLERGVRGARPTAAGSCLLSYYHQSLQQSEILRGQIDALKGVKSGIINISVGPGYLEPLVKVVSDFSEQYPGVQVNIGVHGSNEIIRRVVESESHLGLVYHAGHHPKIISHYATLHPLCVFLAKDHALSQSPSIGLGDLLQHRLALTDRAHGIRQLIRQAEQSQGLELQPTVLCNDMNFLKQYAALGGVTLLPEFMWQPEDVSLIIKPLQEPIFHHPKSQIISRRGGELSLACQMLIWRMMEMLNSGL